MSKIVDNALGPLHGGADTVDIAQYIELRK